LTSTEPGIAIASAIHGAGLVQLPLPYLAPDIAAGRLVAVLADWVQPRIDAFFLYYPSRRQVRPPLKAFTDFLRETYRRPSGAS
jgi:DNA-binding transcriptional LysR family regulator